MLETISCIVTFVALCVNGWLVWNAALGSVGAPNEFTKIAEAGRRISEGNELDEPDIRAWEADREAYSAKLRADYQRQQRGN